MCVVVDLGLGFLDCVLVVANRDGDVGWRLIDDFGELPIVYIFILKVRTGMNVLLVSVVARPGEGGGGGQGVGEL